eukprot:Hpha_TRINITY_DN15125_c3_g10::TRINITY_DN15125_c3_g10_i1::g.126492::m.126492
MHTWCSCMGWKGSPSLSFVLRRPNGWTLYLRRHSDCFITLLLRWRLLRGPDHDTRRRDRVRPLVLGWVPLLLLGRVPRLLLGRVSRLLLGRVSRLLLGRVPRLPLLGRVSLLRLGWVRPLLLWVPLLNDDGLLHDHARLLSGD